ncbi:MAG: hypothetical protein ACFNX0_06100, partial [Treponema sp.]
KYIFLFVIFIFHQKETVQQLQFLDSFLDFICDVLNKIITIRKTLFKTCRGRRKSSKLLGHPHRNGYKRPLAKDNRIITFEKKNSHSSALDPFDNCYRSG